MTTKFVIYGQSRSGSTLLVELLNTHPDVRCDGELFNEDAAKIGNSTLLKAIKAFPIPYLAYQRRRAAERAYGFKLLFYQLPRARHIMKIMARLGWSFVHIYRGNIARQSLSNIVAEETQRWHLRGEEMGAAKTIKVSVAKLQREITTRGRWRSIENELIKHIDHLDLCYEDDLEDERTWPSTAEKLSTFLDLTPFNPGNVSLKKIIDREFENRIENYAELAPILESCDWESREAKACDDYSPHPNW